MVLQIVVAFCSVQATYGQDVITARIRPSEAVVRIARELQHAAFYEVIPADARSRVERTIFFVDWRSESIEQFDEAVSLLDRGDVATSKNCFSYPPAIGLICAAWDVQLDRDQVVLWHSALGCPDNVQGFTRGASGLRCDHRISTTWPWRGERGTLTLQPVAVTPWIGATYFRFTGLIRHWINGRKPLEIW